VLAAANGSESSHFWTPFLYWDFKQYARMLGLSIAPPYILYLKQLTAQMPIGSGFSTR
jgi:hypothetical protein